MIELPAERPDDPRMKGQLLKVDFLSPTSSKAEFEDTPESAFFHYGAEIQYGVVSVTGLHQILNATFPRREANGFYHNKHGLFLEVDASVFVGGLAKSGSKLCLHCRKRRDQSWEWRLVKSLPHEQDKNLLRDFLEGAARNFASGSIRVKASFSDSTGVQSTDIAEWADTKSETSFFAADEPAHVNIGLSGALLHLDIDRAPLPLAVSRVISSRVMNRLTVTFREEISPTGAKPDLPFVAELSPNARKIVKLTHRENAESAGWDQRIDPVRPVWNQPMKEAAEAAVLDAKEDGESDQAQSQQSESAAAPPQIEPSAEDGLWLRDGNEWHRLPVRNWASNPAEGESRHWPISALLPNWSKHLRVDLWLDNCKTKELRVELDARGKPQRFELAFEQIFLSAEVTDNFLPASWQSSSSLPPHVNPRVPWTVPGPMTFLSAPNGSSGSFELSLNVESTQLQSIEHETASIPAHSSPTAAPQHSHWLRTREGLVGPSDWAANDPNAANGISALRGLIPAVSRKSFALTLGDGKAQVSAPADLQFPDFAVGARLLTLRCDDPLLSTEIEISSADKAVVRHRHANPHLDASFVQSRPVGVKDPDLPPDLSWVADRFHDADGSEITCSQLFLEEFPSKQPAATEPNPPTKTELQSQESSLFQVLWYDSRKRWDIYPTARLLEVIGSDSLLVNPLGLRFDNGRPVSLRFNLGTRDKLPHEVLLGRTLEVALVANDAKPQTLPGAVVLSAGWLAEHYGESTGVIDWRGPAEDFKIEFLGIESHNPMLADQELKLSRLIYWFRLDGLDVPFQTDDMLVLHRGKWRFGQDSDSAMTIKQFPKELEPNSGWVAEFAVKHPIAPNLDATEFLLGDRSGDIEFGYAGSPIEFRVRTSYHTEPNGKHDGHVAVLRAGSYHLAWAGKLGERNTSPGSGLQFGQLTRLFLHLRRDDQGRLAATGMVGWLCAEIPGGLRSNWGRATLYASKPGQWDRLRLSGKWTADSKATNQSLRSLVLFRHDFQLQKGDPDSVLVMKPLMPWVVAGYLPASSNREIYCYQRCSWQGDQLKLQGDVLLLPPKINDDPNLSFARAAVQVQAHDPARVRWLVEVARHAEEALHLRALNPEELEQGFLPPHQVEAKEMGEARLRSPSSRDLAFGLTLTEGNAWLICPVRHVHEKAFDDQTRKLWILREDEEDMISLEGFIEKLGEREFDTTDPADFFRLLRCAEETLSFVRWRKPAVLEFWVKVGTESIPKWTLVDAPLLNPFSSLDFMDVVPAARSSSLQPAPGRICREHQKSDNSPLIAKPGLDSTDFRIQTATDKHKHPLVSASFILTQSEPCSHSVLQLRREIPFELADKAGVWNIDDAPWIDPAHAFLNEDLTPIEESTLLPDTHWTFACPRPGELLQVEFEVAAIDRDRNDDSPSPDRSTTLSPSDEENNEVNGDNASAKSPAGEERTLLVSPLSTSQVRTPRAAVKERIELQTIDTAARHIQWKAGITETHPSQPGAALRILGGIPNLRQIGSGTPWPLAVAARNNSEPLEEGQIVAVEFKSDQPFDVQAGDLICQADGTDTKSVWLLMGTEAYGHAVSIVASASTKSIKVQMGIAKLPPETAHPEKYAFAKTQLALADLPESVDIPNPTFEILPDRESESLLPPMPYLIGLLKADKVIAYGPSHLDVGIEFSSDKTDCHWMLSGSWTPPNDRFDWRPDALVAIRPDGSVNDSKQKATTRDLPVSPTEAGAA